MPYCRSIPEQPSERPAVMSIRALLAAFWYSHGLMKPIAGFPARKRASLRRATIEATSGAAADVPPLGVAVPLTMVM